MVLDLFYLVNLTTSVPLESSECEESGNAED